jgi:hypothetical protein
VTIGVDPEEITFRDADAFDEWLALHHSRNEGVWIKIAKKGSGIASITSDEAVAVGLCWGWIFSHRRPWRAPTTCRSTSNGSWSRSNSPLPRPGGEHDGT